MTASGAPNETHGLPRAPRATWGAEEKIVPHALSPSFYLEADRRLLDLYADAEGWARKAILKVAPSGKFSSDRTIAE